MRQREDVVDLGRQVSRFGIITIMLVFIAILLSVALTLDSSVSASLKVRAVAGINAVCLAAIINMKMKESTSNKQVSKLINKVQDIYGEFENSFHGLLIRIEEDRSGSEDSPTAHVDIASAVHSVLIDTMSQLDSIYYKELTKLSPLYIDKMVVELLIAETIRKSLLVTTSVMCSFSDPYMESYCIALQMLRKSIPISSPLNGTITEFLNDTPARYLFRIGTAKQTNTEKIHRLATKYGIKM